MAAGLAATFRLDRGVIRDYYFCRPLLVPSPCFSLLTIGGEKERAREKGRK